MKKLRYMWHPNHVKILENPQFDKDGLNDGWTGLYNSEEKMNQIDCGKCLSTLIGEVEKSMKSGKKIDASVLKDCYKVVFTVEVNYPINYLVREVLAKYDERYGDSTEFHGKLGSSGRGGSRVILFYENSPEDVAERKEQLVELVDDLNLIGMISETRACEYMFHHLNLDKDFKSRVRYPEILLQKLKKNKRV